MVRIFFVTLDVCHHAQNTSFAGLCKTEYGELGTWKCKVIVFLLPTHALSSRNADSPFQLCDWHLWQLKFIPVSLKFFGCNVSGMETAVKCDAFAIFVFLDLTRSRPLKRSDMGCSLSYCLLLWFPSARGNSGLCYWVPSVSFIADRAHRSQPINVLSSKTVSSGFAAEITVPNVDVALLQSVTLLSNGVGVPLGFN